MKKVLLFAIIAVSLQSIAKAQISKGSILLGGGVSINQTKYNNSPVTLPGVEDKFLSISPVVGITIKENLVMGIKFNYGRSDQTYSSTPTSNSENETTVYGGGLFLRKYLTLGKGFYLFGDGSLDYTKNKRTHSYISSNPSIVLSNSQEKGWNVGLGFNPGLSYAVNKKFHLEAGLPNLLSLNYGRGTSSNNGKKTSFGFSSNVSSSSFFTFGFRVLLAK